LQKAWAYQTAGRKAGRRYRGIHRHLRMSPQFAALRPTAKQSCEEGTVLWEQNPRISGREEVGIAGRSQDGEDASLPQGSGGWFYHQVRPARRETPGFFFLFNPR